MKKIIASLILFAGAATNLALADTPISQSELPQAAQTFIATYFSGDQVRKVEKDHGRRGVQYEVEFISKAEIDFDANGEWREVKAARGASVPDGIVPEAIASYVNTNFPGIAVKEISRKRGGFEVELTNGSELHLTADGKPMQPRRAHH